LVEYVVLVGAAYAVPIALAIARGSWWCALPLATAPLALRRIGALARAATGPEHNACLAATAQLLLFHGALLAIGLVA
jgi:1,4-dihydroxy-2-naphthoate octaprenyltransferase